MTLSSILRNSAVPLAGIALLLSAFPASAEGTRLIKINGNSAVYFQSTDGKRYVFPNESVFKSWYPGAVPIQTVTPTELASYPLGGNMTYRPGAQLVKVTTNPKVYAVSRHGMLRWITSEQVAIELYGKDWAKSVADVPDEFFVNYKEGTAVGIAAGFVPEIVEDKKLSPEANLGHLTSDGTPTTPTAEQPAAVPEVTITLGTPTAIVNQVVPITVKVSGMATVNKIDIYAEGTPSSLATCLGATSCMASFTVQNAPRTERFYAIATDQLGKGYTSADRPTLSSIAASNSVQMSVTAPSIAAGGKTGFTSQAMGLSVKSHKVYALIPGEAGAVLWKDCKTESTCTGSTPFYRTTMLYGQVETDTQTLVSQLATVSTFGGEAPKPVLTSTKTGIANQTEVSLQAPIGEMIGITSLVDGHTIDDKAFALCDKPTCSITLQVIIPGEVTAFTWVGGKYEKSNTISVKPE